MKAMAVILTVAFLSFACAPQAIQDDVNMSRGICSVEMSAIDAAYPAAASMPANVREFRESFADIKRLLGPVKAWMTFGDPNSPANR